MATAFRAESHSIAGSGANANPGEPAGAASGDVFIGMIVVTGTLAAPSLPTGWTSLYTVTSTRGTTSNGFKGAVGYIVRGAGAAATQFTNASGYREAFILAFSGVDNTTPIDSQSSSGSTATANADIDPPSTTAVALATMAVCGGVNWGGSAGGGWGAPTNYTLRSNNAAGNDGAIATRQLVLTGAENPGTFSNRTSGSFDVWNGFTITLLPAGVGTSQALVGSSAGTSTTTGDLTVAHSLAGSTAGTAGDTGDAIVAHALIGSSAGIATATGDVIVAHSLIGASAGASSAAGDVIVSHALAGSSAGAATAAGAAVVGYALAGTSAGVAGTGAGLSAALVLAGETDGVSSAAGTLGRLVLLEGTTGSTETVAAGAPEGVGLLGVETVFRTGTLVHRL